MHDTGPLDKENKLFRSSSHFTTTGGLANVFSVDVTGSADFNAESLLREQREFLQRAHASQIRASLFLQLRLRAQKKMKIQKNQCGGGHDMRQKPLIKAGGFVGSGLVTNVQGITDIATPTADNEYFVENGRNFSVVSQRSCDPFTPTQQPSVCRKGTVISQERACSERDAISARTSTGIVPNCAMLATLNPKTEFHNLPERMDSASGSHPHVDGAAAGCRNTILHSFVSFRRDWSADRVSMASTSKCLRAESQDNSRSRSFPCSCAMEDRREEHEEKIPKREGVGSSSSKDPLLSPSIFPVMNQIMHTGTNDIDGVPAAVADRQSGESGCAVAKLPSWSSEVGTTGGGDRDGIQAKNQCLSPLSLKGTSMPLGSVGGITSMVEEKDGTEEPLKPCPHCGRQFFAVSSWPRHVAVCVEQKQQQRPKKDSVSRQVQGSRSVRSSQRCLGANIDTGRVKRVSAQSIKISREQFDTKGGIGVDGKHSTGC